MWETKYINLVVQLILQENTLQRISKYSKDTYRLIIIFYYQNSIEKEYCQVQVPRSLTA